MISGDDNITVDQVREAYEKADQAIKEYERLVLASPWAAVNQIRCAGYHLLHAKIAGVGSVDERCQLWKAKGHCQRAWFDAFEGIIYSHLDFIAKFHDVCRTRRKIESVYSDYRADYDVIVALQERLRSRPMVQTMSEEERQEVLEIAIQVKALKVKMLKLWSTVQSLDLARRDEEMLVAARQFLTPFMATVAGTLFGLLGLGMGVWDKVRCCGLVLGVVLCLVGAVVSYGMLSIFYRWSVKHLLTVDQRMLLKNNGFTLR